MTNAPVVLARLSMYAEIADGAGLPAKIAGTITSTKPRGSI